MRRFYNQALSLILAFGLVACEQNPKSPANLDYEQRWNGGEFAFSVRGTHYQCRLQTGTVLSSSEGSVLLPESEMICSRFRNVPVNWQQEREQIGGSTSLFLTNKVGPFPVVRVGFDENRCRYSFCETGAGAQPFLQVFQGTFASREMQRLLQASTPGVKKP